jgi:Skp family chaperone for outer membrane proteins
MGMKLTQGGMWSRALVVVALCGTAVVASGSLRPAPAPVMAPATAVGVVNLKTLLAGLTEFKEGMALIEEKKKQGQEGLKQIEAQLKKVQDDFELLPKDGPMGPRLDLQVKIAELQGLGEARATATTRSLEVQAGDLLRRVFKKAEESAQRLAAKDGWDIILIDDRSVTPPERVSGKEGRRLTVSEVESVIQQRTILVADDKKTDVTPALLALMNNEFKAGVKR